jgi:hypothetical protein
MYFYWDFKCLSLQNHDIAIFQGANFEGVGNKLIDNIFEKDPCKLYFDHETFATFLRLQFVRTL